MAAGEAHVERWCVHVWTEAPVLLRTPLSGDLHLMEVHSPEALATLTTALEPLYGCSTSSKSSLAEEPICAIFWSTEMFQEEECVVAAITPGRGVPVCATLRDKRTDDMVSVVCGHFRDKHPGNQVSLLKHLLQACSGYLFDRNPANWLFGVASMRTNRILQPRAMAILSTM